MKNRPIHENLDTSFVNLSALIRYLRRRQFSGNVCVKLSGYEADIILTADNKMRVREYDHIAGRVAEGEEALQRILIRARESGGTISVFQTIEEKEPAAEKSENIKKVLPEVKTKSAVANGNHQTAESLPGQNGHPKPVHIVSHQNGKPKPVQAETPLKNEADLPKPKVTLQNFPFEFSNKFEDKARQIKFSPEDLQTLINLLAELLSTIDQSLANAGLNFSAAFRKAGAEISEDYPFLNPNSDVFVYRHGKIMMREKLNAKVLVAGILEILRRILEKLGANPKFSEVYRSTTQNILALIHNRKPLYDKFSITRPLEKILGT